MMVSYGLVSDGEKGGGVVLVHLAELDKTSPLIHSLEIIALHHAYKRPDIKAAIGKRIPPGRSEPADRPDIRTLSVPCLYTSYLQPLQMLSTGRRILA